MYIGEASKRSGLSIKAIRLYEEKGLIKVPERIGRYRIYQERDIELLVLIKEAKELGITLSELKGVITYSGDTVDWGIIKSFLKDVRVQLTDQIESLNMKIENLDKCYEQIDA